MLLKKRCNSLAAHTSASADFIQTHTIRKLGSPVYSFPACVWVRRCICLSLERLRLMACLSDGLDKLRSLPTSSSDFLLLALILDATMVADD